MALPLVILRDSDEVDALDWPIASEAEFGRELRYATRVGDVSREEPFTYDLEADVGVIVAAAGDRAHVVATRRGTPAAVRAAEESPGTVLSIILIEPATLSLASEDPEVQSYLASDAAKPEMLVPLDPDTFASVPTLALTKGNAEPAFQAALDRLAQLGAEVTTIPTAGHVGGVPSEANDLIREFADRVEARVSG